MSKNIPKIKDRFPVYPRCFKDDSERSEILFDCERSILFVIAVTLNIHAL